MRKPGAVRTIWAVPLLIFLFASCGGGGADPSSGSNLPPNENPSLPAKILSWVPPSSYTDGSPLNPATELHTYEIYVKEGGVFSEADDPVALVSAIDPGSGGIVTSFNLANLAQFLSLGVQYNVALKAVSITGTKSGFSGPAAFYF